MRVSFGPSDGGALTLASVVARAGASLDRAGCHAQIEGARYRVRLWGGLPPIWCGNLSLHCHAANIGIVDLDARDIGAGRWAASALLEPIGDKADALSRDFVAMARHRPRLVPTEPKVTIDTLWFDVDESAATWRIYVAAPDRIGLLAVLFERIAACGLRPREIAVRTRGGRAEDWITLTDIAGASPAQSAIDSLRQKLSELADAGG